MSGPVEVAMVFAAGRGERMRPLSDAVPKPALPLPEGPLVASALRLVAEAGAQAAVVNTWHLAGRMEAALGRLQLGRCELRVSRETELMGTAGGLALACHRGLLDGSGPVLVANGDCRLRLDLGPLLERHRRACDLVTLALQPNPDPTRWSRVRLGEEGRVVGILPPGRPEAGDEPFLYTGVMLVAREAVASLPLATGGVAERLWSPALREGRLGAASVSGSWSEVGEPEAYLDTVLGVLGRRSVVEPGAAVGGGAEVVRSLIGAGGSVGGRAVVVESVVAEGAAVGPGARVEGSVLLGAVEVEAGGEAVGVFRAAPG